MSEAISEARHHTASRNDRVKAQHGGITSAADIMKIFKKASKRAIKMGTAQLQYEDMVRRAERKMADLQRVAVEAAENHTSSERAEAIATELYHTPGSLLTSQELAHMWQESGCIEAQVSPNCQLPTLQQFRTADGTCNNAARPAQGAAQTSFRRLLPPDYEDDVSSLRGDRQSRRFAELRLNPFAPPNPSARFISSTVIQDVQNKEIPFTHILMQWGQFLDHDLDLSPEIEAECEGCEFTEICEPVFVPASDPAFGKGTLNNANCLPLRRSAPTCSDRSFSPREQINDVTSYIDGSMVYGSSEELARALREFRGGRLRVGPNFPAQNPSLPVIDRETREFVACPDRDDCFLCGDARCNEQISLTIMHTLWVREHNRCTRELATINPHFGDERLYQECRRIVGALIQKITYLDYLPKVMGIETFRHFIGAYRGYDPSVDASVPNSFATAAYRYGHSLVRPSFDRLGASYSRLRIGPLDLGQAFFNPPQFRASLGTDPIVRGLVSRNSLRMDEFVNSVLTTRLFQTASSPGLDLASLNIQRGRDHGLPPYLAWRNFCARRFGLRSNFENSVTLANFLRLYGSLETLDLWIGGLAEERLRDSLLGATFACIFGITFADVRNGDSFYFERPGQFTPAQLASLRRDTLSRVLCDNLDNSRGGIQPDAFLSNQSRVSCQQIPRPDLRAFREEPCYLRVVMAPRGFQGNIFTFALVDTVRFLFTSLVFRPNRRSSVAQCQEFQCPSRASPARIVVLSNSDRTDSTRFVSNPRLPANTDTTRTTYAATLQRATVDAGGAGVFTSREACLRSSVDGLRVSFRRGEEEEEEEEKEKEVVEMEWGDSVAVREAEEEEEEEEGMDEAGKKMHISEDVRRALDRMRDEALKDGSIKGVEEGGMEVGEGGAATTTPSDKTLMEELEEALKDL